MELYVHAIYDYHPMDTEYLSFNKGDIIRLLEKPDLEDGWLFGLVHEKKGKFPADYVEDYQPVCSYSLLLFVFSCCLSFSSFLFTFLVFLFVLLFCFCFSSQYRELQTCRETKLKNSSTRSIIVHDVSILYSLSHIINTSHTALVLALEFSAVF